MNSSVPKHYGCKCMKLCGLITMAVAIGGARGAVAPSVKVLPLKNNRNQNTYLNILGSFRYGVV